MAFISLFLIFSSKLVCLVTSYENIALHKVAWQHTGRIMSPGTIIMDSPVDSWDFRYVIYYNNRTHPPFPPGYSSNAFNELCEVGVYGCPVTGYYGDNCTMPCPQNCQEGHCDIVDGTCLGCKAGYIGSRCNEECDRSKFGPDCNKICGHCLQNGHCHHINGSCMNGCDPGYHGTQCSKKCETGKYGIDCQQRCSAFCHTSWICHHITGACRDGCKSGWKGELCLEVQDDVQKSTILYVLTAALSVSVIINIAQLFYIILQSKHRNKQKKNKSYEQTKKENVFTQDISGYDSVISGPEDNYQELATVTADR
uniref:EGF-like domain-containing protein n=1 Tax=Magallana gigas TaxID=29159 RepID=A0A8W8NTF1_MAGGI